jgi:AraC-like DNA-binding protein/ligand-binding sensor protein
METSQRQYSWTELAESQEFHKFAQIVKNLTGIPVAICNPEGSQAKVMCERSEFNPICTVIRSSAEGKQACASTDTLYCHRAAKEHRGIHYSCHAGLIDFVIPLHIEGKHIATINGGQILPIPKSRAGFKTLCENLKNIPFNKKQLYKAYKQVSYMPPEKLSTVMDLLIFFAEYFCEMGRRLRVNPAHITNFNVEAAKEFIYTHFHEEITLDSLAQHIGLSESHLSRIFHKTVGVGFPHYLNLIRLGEAKKLLSITDLPITEIAFKVGFNNLPNFNRVFKAFEKCSPRQYRKLYQISQLTA